MCGKRENKQHFPSHIGSRHSKRTRIFYRQIRNEMTNPGNKFGMQWHC